MKCHQDPQVAVGPRKQLFPPRPTRVLCAESTANTSSKRSGRRVWHRQSRASWAAASSAPQGHLIPMSSPGRGHGTVPRAGSAWQPHSASEEEWAPEACAWERPLGREGVPAASPARCPGRRAGAFGDRPSRPGWGELTVPWARAPGAEGPCRPLRCTPLLHHPPSQPPGALVEYSFSKATSVGKSIWSHSQGQGDTLPHTLSETNRVTPLQSQHRVIQSHTHTATSGRHSTALAHVVTRPLRTVPGEVTSLRQTDSPCPHQPRRVWWGTRQGCPP